MWSCRMPKLINATSNSIWNAKRSHKIKLINIRITKTCSCTWFRIVRPHTQATPADMINCTLKWSGAKALGTCCAGVAESSINTLIYCRIYLLPQSTSGLVTKPLNFVYYELTRSPVKSDEFTANIQIYLPGKLLTRAPCREYRLDNNNIDQLELFSLFA